MSEVDFQVVYDGPALEKGSMNARDLSASLAALDSLFESADSLLNGNKTKQELTVKGSFETGSFKINFASKVGVLDGLKDLLSSDGAAQVVTAHDLIQVVLFGGGACYGLIRLIKWLKGKRPTKIMENDDGTLRIYRQESYVKTERAVIQLYDDYRTRKALEKAILTPLEDGVITEVAFNQPGSRDFEVVTISERDFFIAPDPNENELLEQTYTAYVSLIRVSFREGNKWSVFDGANTINVTVEDEKFLKDVDDGAARFGKGDKLKCRIRVVQFEIESSLRTDYYIEEVLSHDPPDFRGQTPLL